MKGVAVVGEAAGMFVGDEKAAAAFADAQVFEQAEQLPVAGMGPNIIGN